MYSQGYLTQLKELHAAQDRPRGFGGKVKDLGEFHMFFKTWNPRTVLDYGCGKGAILAHLKELYPDILWTGYDPAVSMFKVQPSNTFDCVFCNDVLEHIEPYYLDAVLSNIFRLAEKNIWLRIDTKPARKKLSDGRNAHLIIENKDWWDEKLKTFNWTIEYSQLNKKGKLDYAFAK